MTMETQPATEFNWGAYIGGVVLFFAISYLYFSVFGNLGYEVLGSWSWLVPLGIHAAVLMALSRAPALRFVRLGYFLGFPTALLFGVLFAIELTIHPPDEE